jgi:hypothetical protein
VVAPDESEDRPVDSPGAGEPCSPCRATGQVVSNLGGKREKVTCPWCDGGGTRLPREHDAQSRFKDAQDASAPDDPPEPEAA